MPEALPESAPSQSAHERWLITPTRPHLFDLEPEALAEHCKAWGLAKFRAKQIVQWVDEKQVADPAAMSNLSRADRQTLQSRLLIASGAVVGHQRATDGVQKLLMRWGVEPASDQAAEQAAEARRSLPVLDIAGDGLPSGPETEAVVIPSERSNAQAADGEAGEGGRARQTACISSQVGCPVGCHFCASGLGGLEGNLPAGRIVEQVWRLGTLPGVDRITNVVFMGMGEPLANFAQVTRAVRLMTAPWGLNLSARKITISTVGLPAQIRRLAELSLPVTLALSLHAPNDELRRKLIPWAERVAIDDLLGACRHYFDKTGREITLEYTLLREINDRPEHAAELARVAKRIRANVNLIRYNEVRSLPFHRPASEDVHRFQQRLRQAGINTHIRASRGRDIAAACGQLRHEARQL